MYQIMLVEDEMLVRESMAQNTNWDKFGFAPPHVFENGRQALEQLESVLPDVVITDICMPFVDGLELARNIYEKFPDTIVVVLTGFSEFPMRRRPSGTMSTIICSSPSARRSLISCWRTCLRSFRAGTTGRGFTAGPCWQTRC